MFLSAPHHLRSYPVPGTKQQLPPFPPSPAEADAAYALLDIFSAPAARHSTDLTTATTPPTHITCPEPARRRSPSSPRRVNPNNLGVVPLKLRESTVRQEVIGALGWEGLEKRLSDFMSRPWTAMVDNCLFEQEVKFGKEDVLLRRFVLPISLTAVASLREWEEKVVGRLRNSGQWPNGGSDYTFVTQVERGSKIWLTVQDICKIVKFLVEMRGGIVNNVTNFKATVYSHLRAASTVPHSARLELRPNAPFLLLLKKLDCIDMCRLQKVYICNSINFQAIVDHFVPRNPRNHTAWPRAHM